MTSVVFLSYTYSCSLRSIYFEFQDVYMHMFTLKLIFIDIEDHLTVIVKQPIQMTLFMLELGIDIFEVRSALKT